MNDESLDKLEQLFQEAQMLLPYARPAFLDDVCGDNDNLRAKLESLLEADAQARTERFLDDLAADLAAMTEPVSPERRRKRPEADLHAISIEGRRQRPDRPCDPPDLSRQPIERHVDRQGKIARPRSERSRFANFLRRRRIEVAAAAVGALVAGLGTAFWQTRRQ